MRNMSATFTVEVASAPELRLPNVQVERAVCPRLLRSLYLSRSDPTQVRHGVCRLRGSKDKALETLLEALRYVAYDSSRPQRLHL
jgi:hypothetical protein